jgi:heptosyltransferase-1
MNEPPLVSRKYIERLLVVRLSAMGDIIHTLPAAAALRAAFPHTMIGWVVEERWLELLSTLRTPRFGPTSPQRPLADRIHVVRTVAWRKAPFSHLTWHDILVAVSDLRGIHYDVAIDFQGAIRSAVLARVSRAPVVYGYAQPRENAASMMYTRQVLTNGNHVIDQNLALAQTLAQVPLTPPDAQFPSDPGVEEHVHQLLADKGLKEFAILNPGAGWGAKRWPAERYGVVAKKLAEIGLLSFVNFGPGEEYLAETVTKSSEGIALPLNCSITELIAITRRATLFIGGDTGPMHLAAALKVPVVAIFGPTNPARNGPYGTKSVVLRNPESPTTHARLARPDEAMLEITADNVFRAAVELLGVSHD